MKKKFKFIFPFISILFITFCSSAFAVSYDGYKFPDFPEGVDLNNSIIEYVPSKSYYRLYYFSEVTSFGYYNSSTKQQSSIKLDGYTFCVNGLGGSSYTFDPKTSDSWVLNKTYSNTWIVYDFQEIVYSGFDLIYPDTNETFFQATPWTGSIVMQSLITRNFWQPVSKTLNVLVSLGTLLLGSLVSVILLRRYLIL